MLKKIIAGFIILVAGMAIVHMFTGATQQAERRAHEAQARPQKLSHLKRPAVRQACEKNSDWDIDSCEAIDGNEITVGMNAEQVRLAWGNPKRINTTVLTNRTREQWVYGTNYVYFNDGIVSSMQSSRQDQRQTP
jgi:hypothetical protein